MAERITGHVRLIERKSGPVYYSRIRFADGRQSQKAIGPKWTGRGRPPAGHFTDKTAEEHLQTMLTDARRGTLEGSVAGSGRTFGDACAEWLRYCRDDKQLTASTMRDYRNTVRCHLLPEFGSDLPIEAVTTDRIEIFRERLLENAVLSRRSIQKFLVLLHGIMKRAKRRKWITSNPSEDVERVTVRPTGDFTVLSPVEVAAVAQASTSNHLAALFTVAAFTGLRLGEIRALRWADIDFAGRMVMVRRNHPSHGDEKAPKSGKVRSVPLIDQAARVLDDLSRRELFTEPGDRVFCSPTGGVMDDVPIRRQFYAALTAAGLGHLRDKEEPIVFHDLRHTFGTLGAAIWPLHDLQGYMGHADIATTMIYVHHVPKVQAADELSQVVASAMMEETPHPDSVFEVAGEPSLIVS